MKMGVTMSDTGERIGAEGFGSATGPGSSVISGGGGGRDHEVMYDAGLKYVLMMRSETDGNIVSYDVSWYEHTRTFED